MLNRHWRKLLREEDEMSSVGSVIWAAIIFGGGTALVLLYLLDTQTALHPALKAITAIILGLLPGSLAASFRWFRILAICSVVILTALHLVRGWSHF